jgi:hypothetical protein
LTGLLLLLLNRYHRVKELPPYLAPAPPGAGLASPHHPLAPRSSETGPQGYLLFPARAGAFPASLLTPQPPLPALRSPSESGCKGRKEF